MMSAISHTSFTELPSVSFTPAKLHQPPNADSYLLPESLFSSTKLRATAQDSVLVAFSMLLSNCFTCFHNFFWIFTLAYPHFHIILKISRSRLGLAAPSSFCNSCLLLYRRSRICQRTIQPPSFLVLNYLCTSFKLLFNLSGSHILTLFTKIILLLGFKQHNLQCLAWKIILSAISSTFATDTSPSDDKHNQVSWF